MTEPASISTASKRKAYIITGPTSGIGRATAFELAKHGTIVLVGRDSKKLNEVQEEIERELGQAIPIVCDLSDIARVRQAAVKILDLHLPLAGLVNNAGIHQTRPTKNAQGWDVTFATNHLGPFALTEALIPHLADGANVVFVASGVEDPERKPAKMAGFRGGAVHIGRGECTRRVGAWRIQSFRRGCICHLEAVHPRHGVGVCPRDPAFTLQRR